MKSRLIIPLGAALLSLLGGCYPGGADYIDELDIVATNFDPEFDFQNKGTYAIPDRVVKITGALIDDPDGDGEPEYVKPVYADVILAAIKRNMDAMGWTEVDKNANPDVILLPSAIETTNLYFYYDWWWWGWYYPGWCYCWGWWYPGYYPPSVTSYTTGSLFIQMTYPDGLSASDNIPVTWTAVFNGLLEGSTAGINQRIDRAVDQAFEQSPYLQQ